MNENINLCEILKDCPKGTELYSSVHGKVLLSEIYNSKVCPIEVIAYGYDNKEFTASFTADGRFLHFCIAECVLFPSKDQRDWSKFSAPWYKPENKDTEMEKFDPKTLKSFNKVLVRDYCDEEWTCDIFSHIIRQDDTLSYMCIFTHYDHCIPYNDDTKHLVGTTDEAPEFYRYWED